MSTLNGRTIKWCSPSVQARNDTFRVQEVDGSRCQYNIKSLWLFGLICVQNSISSLVLYNRLNSIKSLWLFGLICVKICNHLYLFSSSNYHLQTLQNYSDFIQSFLFSNLNSYLVFHYWNIYLEICFNYFVITSLIINQSWY